jgi:hypothetical protein
MFLLYHYEGCNIYETILPFLDLAILVFVDSFAIDSTSM